MNKKKVILNMRFMRPLMLALLCGMSMMMPKIGTAQVEPIDITEAFTDVNFRNEVYKNIGKTAPAIIWSNDAILTIIRTLDVSNKNISSLAGIQYLTKLESLDCSRNQLTELDLSGLTNLQSLDCSYNQFTDLYLSGFWNLKTLTVRGSQLTGLYLSGLTNLQTLTVVVTQLTDLDLSGLTNLKTLTVRGSQLTELDLSGLTSLQSLDCSSTQLTELDLSGLTNLQGLSCSFTQLTELDLSGLTNLGGLDCAHNQLTSLYTYGCSNLQWLDCSYNQLTELDLYGLTNLQSLDCHYNQLTELDLYGLTNLQTLTCAYNHLTELNLSGLTNLRDLSCWYNQLTELNLSGLTNLRSLNCEYNNMNSPTDVIGWYGAGHEPQEGDGWYPQNTLVSDVTLNKSAISMRFGEEEILTATVMPEDANNKYVTWSSSNTAVATVANGGLVKGVSGGTATITATTLAGKTATCAVTVIQLPVTGITLNKTTVSAVLGTKEQVVATVAPANASNKAVKWSSDNTSVAKVNSNTGRVRATGIGTATITATTRDGGHIATCAFTVVYQPVTGVTLNETATVSLGFCEQLTASITPDNAGNKAVTWSSSNVAVATVSEDGLVCGTGLGTATITVTTQDGEYTANCEVTVVFPTDITAAFTDDCFREAVYVAIGKTAPEPILYIDVAEITSLSLYHNCIYSLAGIQYFAGLQELTVANTQLTELDLSGLTNLQSLYCNNNNHLTEIDLSGCTNLQSLYCPGNQLSSLDVSGLTNLYSLTCTFNQLTSLNVSGLTNLQQLICEYNQLSSLDVSGLTNLQYLDCRGSQLSSLDVAGLTNLQTLFCYNNQLTELNVSGCTSLQGLYCTENQLSSLDVSGLTNLQSLDCGSNQLTALDVSILTNLQTLYCNNNQLTSLNVYGLPLSSLNCTYNNMITTDDVNEWNDRNHNWSWYPQNTRVSDVTLNKSASSMIVGESEQLTATIAPSDAANHKVTWSSSNIAVAMVSDSGMVTGVSVGTATITATTRDIGKTATCTVTIIGLPVTGVTLNKTATNITAGDTVQLTADITPEHATNKAVIWSSSNGAVATVSDNGLLTGVSAGTVTITVTTQDGGYTDTCAITVVSPVTGISLHKTATNITPGETEQLYAVITPQNAINKAVTWSSSNEAVAKVNASGLVTAVSVGTATITVTTDDGGHTAICAVTVVYYPVTGVTLNETATLSFGSTMQLMANITPNNASNKAVTWSSSNMAVAKVSENGLVRAAGLGTATVTVTTREGGHTASCAVTVGAPTDDITAAFTDRNFRNAVYAAIGKTAPAPILYSDVAEIRSLNVYNKGISSLAGIQYFTGLQTLNCGRNQLTELDLSGLTNLQSLDCSEMNLHSLDLSGLPNLQSLDCGYNQLQTLNLSGLPNLQSLDCSSNQFTDLDLSGLTNLQEMICLENQLTEIDLSGLTNLQTLDCQKNQLIGLDLSGLTNLQSLNCGDNQLQTLNVSGLKNLKTLVCGRNQLQTLNVLGLRNLQSLVCDQNQLTELKVSGFWNLQILYCPYNKLQTLNVSGLTNLQTLNCSDNNMWSTNNVTGWIEGKGWTFHPQNSGTSGVTLNKAATTIAIGSSEDLLATFAPEPDDATTKTVRWSSSNKTVATVDEYGMFGYTRVTGVSAGTATITVTTNYGGYTATCMVTVISLPVTGVSLNTTETTINVNTTEQLTATITPENASNKTVTWTSSNEAVATVNASGLVTAISKGSANITVITLDGGYSEVCEITVVQPTINVTSVTLNKTSATIDVDATEQLTAIVAPANASNKAVTWSSSDTAVAKVNANGLVTAVSAGTATITVKTQDRGFTKSCAITVIQPVTGVSLNKTATTINAGAIEQLTATVAPDNANNQNVTWSSSNNTVATVSDNGLVTAVSAGTATITVKTEDGNKTATCAVTVIQPVTGVSLNKTTAIIAVNATEQLSATVAPANANNKNVTWSSSDTAVAKVNDGLVTTISLGTVTITVTTLDGSKTATCAVTVVQPVTGVSLNKTATTINAGAIEQLTATVAPDNATNKTVEWSSSNNTVATVSDNGLVTAVSAGTANITVTTEDGNKTATCAVTVNAITVTGIMLNKNTTTMITGGAEQLMASIAPANATNKTIAWSSSNNAVATVNVNGLVTAVSAGTATITATTQDGGKTATCAVTVSASTQSVTGVSLNKSATAIVVGSAEQLSATVAPATATNQNVTWSSSNAAVASVNSTGLVTAVSVGTATITVTTQDGEKTASCTVNVSASTQPVTGVSLNKNATTINVGTAEQLTVSVAPANATKQNVTWSSNNSSVATVSTSGLVTATGPGTANITVTTEDGGHTATCAVTVNNLPINFTALALDGGVKVALYRNVRLNCTFSGGVPTHFRTAESEAAVNNAVWQAYNAATLLHTFASSAHGYKTVYAQLKNGVGETAVRNAVIIYKPEHPKQEVRGFAINAGAWSTASRTVNLNHSVINAVPTLYSASENPLLVGKEWLPYKKLPQFTLSNGAGLKEVYFAVANAADTSDIVSSQIWLDEPATKAGKETEATSTLSVKLYPNPVETAATVEVDGGTGNVQVSVYDVSGRMYLSRTFDTQTFSLDLTDCPSGILLVRIVNNGNSVIKKVIKN